MLTKHGCFEDKMLHHSKKVGKSRWEFGRDGTFFDSAGTLYKMSLMLLFSVTPFRRLTHPLMERHDDTE